MQKSRRDFIKHFSSAATLVTLGGFQSVHAADLSGMEKDVRFRFIVASDAHFGQPKTPFEKMTDTFVQKANVFHGAAKCDFCVLNGDIIHDDSKFMPMAKKHFDKLKMPIHVTQGNHDHLTAENWQLIWGSPVNYSFDIKGFKVILATTSDETGTYLSPDIAWLSAELAKTKGKPTLLFIHIPQTKWTANAIETPAFFELLNKHKNVKAVFHGHEHDQDGIFKKDETPFIFDSHIGGSWGTDYKGFRVVEVLKNNSLVTYMMNPDVAQERVEL